MPSLKVSSSVMVPVHPKLFTVVHVCEPLAKHDDPGMRILNKISKQNNVVADNSNSLELPLLLHDGNILREGRSSSLMTCLLPEYIDEAIGKKNLLRPNDAVGLYNMKLVSLPVILGLVFAIFLFIYRFFLLESMDQNSFSNV